MSVEGLAEMRRGVNQGWERARAGVDQFLHDERGSARPSVTRVAALALGIFALSVVSGYALGLKLDGIPADQFFLIAEHFNKPFPSYVGYSTVIGEIMGGLGAMATIVIGLRSR